MLDLSWRFHIDNSPPKFSKYPLLCLFSCGLSFCVIRCCCCCRRRFVLFLLRDSSCAHVVVIVVVLQRAISRPLVEFQLPNAQCSPPGPSW